MEWICIALLGVGMLLLGVFVGAFFGSANCHATQEEIDLDYRENNIRREEHHHEHRGAAIDIRV